MTNTFPAFLNETGRKHVAEELARLDLSWDVAATCSDIENKISFGDLVQGRGDGMDYEISNIRAGIKSYGAYGSIEILADEHVYFEASDE